jgi:arylsulfatase A-like enzyme
MTKGYPNKGGRHGDAGLKIGREGLEPVFDFVAMAQKEKKPFSLWYAPFLPHTPHTPPERILKSYRDKGLSASVAKYYAMCEWFDETCGQLLDHLDEEGLRDDTLVLYVADNGWIQQENSNGYAPRSKRSPYEGGTRTPIMLRWPDVIPPAARPELCSSIDLVPTILSAAGAKIPGKLDGLNLLPTIRDGKPLGRKAIFGESFAHDIADIENPEASLLYRWVIEDQWKLLLTYDGAQGRMKYPPAGFAPQLYELKNDPLEKTNLAGDHPELVARLSKRIDGWWPVTKRKQSP